MNFDLAKGVVVAIAVVVGSWYDLKGEVKAMQAEVASTKSSQISRDQSQDTNVEQLRADIRQGFTDLRADLRTFKK